MFWELHFRRCLFCALYSLSINLSKMQILLYIVFTLPSDIQVIPAMFFTENRTSCQERRWLSGNTLNYKSSKFDPPLQRYLDPGLRLRITFVMVGPESCHSRASGCTTSFTTTMFALVIEVLGLSRRASS